VSRLTDRDVLARALEIIRHQWCQGAFVAEVRKPIQLPDGRRAHKTYCMIGALMRVMRLTYDNHNLRHPRLDRIAGRLLREIREAYPDWWNRERPDFPHPTRAWVVERFNDNHTHEDMIRVCEKALAREDW